MKDARRIDAAVEFKDHILKLPDMISSIEPALSVKLRFGSNASSKRRLNAYARRFIRLYGEVSGMTMPISFIVVWDKNFRFEVSLGAEDDMKLVTIKPVDEEGLDMSKDTVRLYDFEPFFSYLSFVVDNDREFSQKYSFPEDTRNDTQLMKILRSFGVVKASQPRIEV